MKQINCIHACTSDFTFDNTQYNTRFFFLSFFLDRYGEKTLIHIQARVSKSESECTILVLEHWVYTATYNMLDLARDQGIIESVLSHHGVIIASLVDF